MTALSGALRNFLVVFLLALLGFGIIGHFIATVAVPALTAEEESSTVSSASEDSLPPVESSEDDTASVDVPVSGTAYNAAFFCFDANDKLAGVYLVHTNDGYKTCVGVTVPGDASVENNGAYSTLAQLYENEGKDFLLTKLYYLTGCKIDEYADLCAIDKSGDGRNITRLATYMQYTYRLTEGFEYPNPDYDHGEESGDNDEMLNIEAGSYALNGETEGIKNEKLLLDLEYNVNAFDIYTDTLTRLLSDSSLASDTARQTKIMGYMLNKSFGDYNTSGAKQYLFNDYVKATISYSGTGGAWDEIREAIKTLERKV